MILQRTHADRAAAGIAGYEQGERRIGHLLDRELKLELARRERDQIGVERGDKRANVVL